MFTRNLIKEEPLSATASWVATTVGGAVVGKLANDVAFKKRREREKKEHEEKFHKINSHLERINNELKTAKPQTVIYKSNSPEAAKYYKDKHERETKEYEWNKYWGKVPWEKSGN
jgi:hypothetical protein